MSLKQKIILHYSNVGSNKLNLKSNQGEICLTNFIPPANGASMGSHFCFENLTHALKQCLNNLIVKINR